MAPTRPLAFTRFWRVLSKPRTTSRPYGPQPAQSQFSPLVPRPSIWKSTERPGHPMTFCRCGDGDGPRRPAREMPQIELLCPPVASFVAHRGTGAKNGLARLVAFKEWSYRYLALALTQVPGHARSGRELRCMPSRVDDPTVVSPTVHTNLWSGFHGRHGRSIIGWPTQFFHFHKCPYNPWTRPWPGVFAMDEVS